MTLGLLQIEFSGSEWDTWRGEREKEKQNKYLYLVVSNFQLFYKCLSYF